MARFARTGQRGTDPGEHREQRDPRRRGDALAVAQYVSAGNVAQLVSDHALDFLGGIGRFDQARMDIDNLPARDEGIDRAIVDEDDIDIFGLQPRRLDQRSRDFVEEGFGLGIAQNGLSGDRLRREHGGGKESEQAGYEAHRRTA